jgi:DNA helicase-2/ATP-dependent DNA helicase PcrA
MPDDFLSSLNPNQRRAAEHGEGPLLVIAGAGTGKTKTLAARVAALIRRGVEPARILLLTFTRRAAAEMIRRAGQVVGDGIAAGVWNGTFHAVALRLLRIYHEPLGLLANFVCVDPADAADLMNLIRADMGLDKSKTRFPQKGTLWEIYSRTVNTGFPLEQTLEERFPWCAPHREPIKLLFKEYTERKTRRGLLDFDDLLLYWQQALDVPALGVAIAGRFEHVLVDEYQDTNPIQAAVLRNLWARWHDDPPDHAADTKPSPSRSLMVVGDDAQSIYAFRGATVENILDFPQQFANTAVVTLDQNYRSVMPILDAANAVMVDAPRRYTKNLWSERKSASLPELITCADELAQSACVADRLLEFREQGIPLIKQAVLFRASYNSSALEIELARRNIPFVKWGGLRFLEAAHVKDLLAFLRLVENPRDDLSWMRVLQLFDGIGPGRARQALEHLRANEDMPQALQSWKAPPAARDQVDQLAALIHELHGADSSVALPVQIERIRRLYAPILDNRYPQPEMRARDLDQLELLAQKSPSREAFLADLTLDPPTSTGDLAGPPYLDEEYVVLSTIHSAKGCEWPVVFVIHAADGVLPSDMSTGENEIEEERRLLYVAMTRARDQLIVTFPLRYYHRKHAFGDTYSTAQLSRFLPPKLFPLFARSAYGSSDPLLPDGAPGSVSIADDVRARLQRLWE